MWLLYAFGSALFAGVTSILAKCGIRQTDSTVATAVRTIVVLGIRLAHGVGGGGTVPAFYHCPQNLALFGSVWLCHRGILALLFQGFATGQHQPSGPS